MKHTLGMWHVTNSNFVKGANGEPVAMLHARNENTIGNAHLIAAAPDLLEACQLALEKCAFPVGAMGAKQALQDAIRKATEAS